MDKIQPPDHLSEKAKALFRAYVPAAFNAPAQQALFTTFCETIDLHDAMVESIAAHGPMVRGSTGQLRANPLIAEKRALVTQLQSIARQLGLEADFNHVFKIGSFEWLTHQVGA